MKNGRFSESDKALLTAAGFVPWTNGGMFPEGTAWRGRVFGRGVAGSPTRVRLVVYLFQLRAGDGSSVAEAGLYLEGARRTGVAQHVGNGTVAEVLEVADRSFPEGVVRAAGSCGDDLFGGVPPLPEGGACIDWAALTG